MSVCVYVTYRRPNGEAHEPKIISHWIKISFILFFNVMPPFHLRCVSVNQGRSVNFGLSQSDAELFEHFRTFSNTNVISTIHIGQSYVSIRSKWVGVGRCAAIAALMVR